MELVAVLNGFVHSGLEKPSSLALMRIFGEGSCAKIFLGRMVRATGGEAEKSWLRN